VSYQKCKQRIDEDYSVAGTYQNRSRNSEYTAPWRGSVKGAGAYAFGVRGFDTQAALRYMIQGVTQPADEPPSYSATP